MQIVYWIIVAFLATNLAVYIVREKRLVNQAGASLVLIMLLLRLLLIK